MTEDELRDMSGRIAWKVAGWLVVIKLLFVITVANLYPEMLKEKPVVCTTVQEKAK